MEFYKSVSEDDFKRALEDVGYYIPTLLQEIIEKENNVSTSSVYLYKDLTMQTFQKCKKELEKYLSVTNAYNDFKNGKTVYVKY